MSLRGAVPRHRCRLRAEGKELPTVSVILPVKDGAEHLDAAIRSVLDQTWSDLELLVIDDGSRDGSAAIAEVIAARDARVRLLASGVRGIVPALNLGLACAQGEFVARMDADDIALPTRIARQVAALRACRSVAVVGTFCTLFDSRRGTERTLRFPTHPDDIRDALLVRNVMVHPTVMMRRVEGVHYRAAFKMCEDYDLWLRLSEKHANSSTLTNRCCGIVNMHRKPPGARTSNAFCRSLPAWPVRG